MQANGWWLSLLLISGCVSAPEPEQLTSMGADQTCELSRQNVGRLRRQLTDSPSTGEPAALSAPSLARQNAMMQIMRAAAADDKARQRLAAELKFLRERCS